MLRPYRANRACNTSRKVSCATLMIIPVQNWRCVCFMNPYEPLKVIWQLKALLQLENELTTSGLMQLKPLGLDAVHVAVQIAPMCRALCPLPQGKN